MKKAFTLAETLIVLLIVGILTTVLIRSYLTMSDIALRVEQEKSVTQEVLFASEVLQNLADRNSLDYNRYDREYPGGLQTVVEQEGVVEILYLTGIDGEIAIHSEGDCIDPGTTYDIAPYLNTNSALPNCRLELEKSGERIFLTNPAKAYMSTALFKIIPYAWFDDYFGDNGDLLCDTDSTNYLSCLHHPGFWILQHAYARNYNFSWSSRIHIPIQQFFNLQ